LISLNRSGQAIEIRPFWEFDAKPSRAAFARAELFLSIVVIIWRIRPSMRSSTRILDLGRLNHSVRKILLLGIAGHVLERKHGDRRTISTVLAANRLKQHRTPVEVKELLYEFRVSIHAPVKEATFVEIDEALAESVFRSTPP
jgi:hypothetical protein